MAQRNPDVDTARHMDTHAYPHTMRRVQSYSYPLLDMELRHASAVDTARHMDTHAYPHTMRRVLAHAHSLLDMELRHAYAKPDATS